MAEMKALQESLCPFPKPPASSKAVTLGSSCFFPVTNFNIPVFSVLLSPTCPQGWAVTVC